MNNSSNNKNNDDDDNINYGTPIEMTKEQKLKLLLHETRKSEIFDTSLWLRSIDEFVQNFGMSDALLFDINNRLNTEQAKRIFSKRIRERYSLPYSIMNSTNINLVHLLMVHAGQVLFEEEEGNQPTDKKEKEKPIKTSNMILDGIDNQ